MTVVLLLYYPALYGAVSSRDIYPLNTVIFTSIKWSPLFSGRAHFRVSPNGPFLLSSTRTERSLKAEPLI